MNSPGDHYQNITHNSTVAETHLLPLLAGEGASVRQNLSGVEQEQLLLLFKRHRLNLSLNGSMPILKHLLSKDIYTQLQKVIKKKVLRQLNATRTLMSISDKFCQNEIKMIALKGPMMALFLFDSFAKREYIDLDILIQPQDFSLAYSILEELGYEAHSKIDLKGLTPSQLQAFMKIAGDLPFEPKSGEGIRIELHWQFFSPGALFPYSFGDIYKRSSRIEVSGTHIHTPGLEDNLLYLCIHGAKHQWFRLQWLNDIKHLVSNHYSTIDWVRFTKNCELHNLHRPVGQALVLGNKLLGTPLPDSIADMCKNDQKIDTLVRRAINAIHADESMIDGLGEGSVKSITKNLMDLKPGFMHKWACLSRLLLSPKDWEMLRLPEPLFPLYYVLRPFMYVIRRTKHSNS